VCTSKTGSERSQVGDFARITPMQGDSKADRRNAKKLRRKAFLNKRKEDAAWRGVTERPGHWYDVSLTTLG
jgi:hypothetical protein